MNTAVINIKIDPKVKREAQAVAERLGFSLSAVINAYLRALVRTRTVAFSDAHLELTPWAKRMLRQSKKDVKAGYVSPSLRTVEESVTWLNDPNARYENERPVR